MLTPEIAALADYHVDAASIETIGESAFAKKSPSEGQHPVRVILSGAKDLSVWERTNSQSPENL